MRKKLLFASVILLLFSVPLALILEVAVRCLTPQLLLTSYATDSGFGIRIYAPNLSIHHSTPDYRISIRTNSMGLRADREYPFGKPDGVIRIVGLGDSFTFGFGVEMEDTYLARLERGLRRRGVEAEVINLSLPDLGTAEELIMLSELGQKFDPDVVLLGYYRNDIGDTVHSKLYALDGNGDLLRVRKEYLPGVKVRDVLYSFGLYRYLVERSHLLALVRKSFSDFLQRRPEANRVQPHRTGVSARHAGTVRGDAANVKSLSHHDDGPPRLTAALLDEIKRFCDRNGSALVILDIPSEYNRSNLPRALLNHVTEKDIVDVRSGFASRWHTTQLYWKRSWGHWTPAGHEIAADALIERIFPIVAP